jgi:hypothetical protein
MLVLIIYNNAFTKYKIKELNNKWVYVFFTSFISIQFVEFLIWKNIDNTFYNNVFSILATIILFMQPIASLMIVTNKSLRNLLILSYLFLAIPFSVYNFSTNHIHSVIGESGHLRWKFFNTNPIIWITWIFFFLFSFLYEQIWFAFLFGFITLFITYQNYKKDHTMWSMWCWSVNSIMIYYAIYLLIYLPFLEKISIC